jgi:hypothetical protein
MARAFFDTADLKDRTIIGIEPGTPAPKRRPPEGLPNASKPVICAPRLTVSWIDTMPCRWLGMNTCAANRILEK